MDNTKFINAHPELAKDIIRKHGGLDWVNKYSNEINGRITECWERNNKGELVDVTEVRALEREIERLRAKIRAHKEANKVKALLSVEV